MLMNSGLRPFDVHLVATRRQHVRQRRVRRQPLDLDAATVRGPVLVTRAIDDEPSPAPILPAFGGELVGLALIGQRLLRGRLSTAMASGRPPAATRRTPPPSACRDSGRPESADQRQQIDQRGVRAVLPLRDVVVEQEVLGHVEDEDGPHPVVGEPLPHLGEEQDVDASRMAPHLHEHRYARDDGDHDSERYDDVPHGYATPFLQDPDRSSVTAGQPRY